MYCRVFQLRENQQLIGWVYGSRVTRYLRLNTKIEIYNLAGHSQYESSHTAVIESLCLQAPAFFILMVDLTISDTRLRKQVYKWAYFLEIQSSRISYRAIILGSRKDRFSTKPEVLDHKCKVVEQCAKDALGKQHFAGFIALDARQLSSSNIQPFLRLLAKNVNDLIIPRVHDTMSFGCHFLHSFVKENVEENAISFQHLQNLVSKNAFLCHLCDPVKLGSTLETIANKGLLLVFRNGKHLPSSCIVVNKVRLLDEVNGILFPPGFSKEHRSGSQQHWNSATFSPSCYLSALQS